MLNCQDEGDQQGNQDGEDNAAEYGDNGVGLSGIAANHGQSCIHCGSTS